MPQTFVTRRLRLRAATLALLAVVGTVGVLGSTATPAGADTFSNTAPITILDPDCTDPDAALPYPSTITVSGLTGTISDVDVTLNGVTHPFQGDLDVLLVGPTGANLIVLSDAGTGPLTNADITFDDAAASPPPQNTAWAAGTYEPVDYTEISGTDPFPPPAPAPSADTTLAAAFDGTSPNGTWSLYVVDDACPEAGSITGGWTLDITTVGAAATTTTVTSGPNPSRTGEMVVFTATVESGGSPVTTGTVTFTEGVTTLAANVPVNAAGQATLSTSSLAEGNHLVTATYNGTAAFATSSDTVDQRVDNDTAVTGTTYCNTGPITIDDDGPATPYPSNIFVSGLGGALTKVTVTLKNVSHGFAGDVDALLAGPAGQNVVLVSDAGTAPVSNVTVNFDDAAAGPLPASGAWAPDNATITVDPTDHVELGPDSFPAPAPALSGATTLATFDGSDPNGTWRLFVEDDGAPDAGSIAGGWCLTFTAEKASPTISTVASPGGPVGTAVTDTATLSGGADPTGSVTFRLFSDATCSTEVFTSTNPLVGSSATSDWFTPTAPGTYFWTAVYSGDAGNNPAASPCRARRESVTITPFIPPPPTRTITGDLVGPVVVNAGESVLLTNARVVGPVTVNPGGALTVVGSQVTGGITADAPGFLSICGSRIAGPPGGQALGVANATVPIRIGDPATGCAGNRFAGDVNLTANLAVTFGANLVSQNVDVSSNGPGATVIKANAIFGGLTCATNDPPPTNAGQPNVAGSRSGQCSGL